MIKYLSGGYIEQEVGNLLFDKQSNIAIHIRFNTRTQIFNNTFNTWITSLKATQVLSTEF